MCGARCTYEFGCFNLADTGVIFRPVVCKYPFLCVKVAWVAGYIQIQVLHSQILWFTMSVLGPAICALSLSASELVAGGLWITRGSDSHSTGPGLQSRIVSSSLSSCSLTWLWVGHQASSSIAFLVACFAGREICWRQSTGERLLSCDCPMCKPHILVFQVPGLFFWMWVELLHIHIVISLYFIR